MPVAQNTWCTSSYIEITVSSATLIVSRNLTTSQPQPIPTASYRVCRDCGILFFDINGSCALLDPFLASLSGQLPRRHASRYGCRTACPGAGILCWLRWSRSGRLVQARYFSWPVGYLWYCDAWLLHCALTREAAIIAMRRQSCLRSALARVHDVRDRDAECCRGRDTVHPSG